MMTTKKRILASGAAVATLAAGAAVATMDSARADDPWDKAGGPGYAHGCVASAHADVVSRTSKTVTFRPTYWVNCDSMKPIINMKGEIGGAGKPLAGTPRIGSYTYSVSAKGKDFTVQRNCSKRLVLRNHVMLNGGSVSGPGNPGTTPGAFEQELTSLSYPRAC